MRILNEGKDLRIKEIKPDQNTVPTEDTPLNYSSPSISVKLERRYLTDEEITLYLSSLTNNIEDALLPSQEYVDRSTAFFGSLNLSIADPKVSAVTMALLTHTVAPHFVASQLSSCLATIPGFQESVYSLL